MNSYKLVEIEADELFEDENVNWKYCMNHATFTHKEACEFIFSIAEEDEYFELDVTNMKEQGCTSAFINSLKQARSHGAKYVLFYA